MIQNLPERFLYARLPEAVVRQDERGLVEAVLGGFQDRLEDLRSYTRKLGDFWTPGALPDGPNNAILVDVQGDQGKVYTRSLEVLSDTPPANGPALNLWASRQLKLPTEVLSNVRYGRDLLRLVDSNLLSYLAATIGCVLYQSLVFTPDQQTAANIALVDTWFPRLKIKGTAQSFEVLGRLLGFQDVRVTPLWTRLSPRSPDDVGNPDNNADFDAFAEYYPQQAIGVAYDPFAYRDGPFFSWQTLVSNGTADSAFYTQAVTGFNPWVEVVLLGSLAGTNVPATSSGTVTHPATGTYALDGGLPNFKAFVDPVGSSVRFQAISEGDSFNGLIVSVATPGTLYDATGTNVLAVSGSLASVSISDRLSSIKYRSSYFDIGLASSMDTLEEIFGSRAATTNKDLKANPELTSDGTAVSPYRPWVGGSIAIHETTQDWVTASGSNLSVAVVRTEADPTITRQLNVDAALAAGVQVIQAFEEVRPATRLPRRSQFGFLIDDKADYAAYVGTASPLFTTNGSTSVYSGSWPRTPAQSYPQVISAQIGNTTIVSYPEQSQFNSDVFFYRLRQDDIGLNLFGTFQNGSYWFNGTNRDITLSGATVEEYNKTYVYDASAGTYAAGAQKIFVDSDVVWLAATGTANYFFGYYTCDPLLFPVGTWVSSGGGTPPVGRYTFDGMVISAVWQALTTEVIRDEPTLAEKKVGSGETTVFPTYSDATRIQMRPEDDDASLVDVVDEFGWRRDVVAGGELEDLDMYYSGTEFAIDPVDAATVFNDHTGADLTVYGVPSQYTPMRVVIQPRPTDATFMPGNLAVGYQGVFRDLSALTAQDVAVIKLPSGTVSKGDTATEFDSLFLPGYKLFHVGFAQGVMVADLPVFFGPHHRNNLVGWFALNEHPDDDLVVGDHSVAANNLAVTGADPTHRSFDAIRGWTMRVDPAESMTSAAYREIEDEATMSFWLKTVVLPSSPEQIVRVGPLSVQLSSSAISAFVQDTTGTPQLIGVGSLLGEWTFVYIRASSTSAYANISSLSVLGTEAALTGQFIPDSPDNSINVKATTGVYRIHDLRVWNSQKSAQEMDKVRYHRPTPTLCTYPLGYITTVDRGDRLAIQVLPSGWAVPGNSLAWYRRSHQGYVRRYDSMGSYHGEDRFKETGIGDGRALPPTYQLGHQFTTMTSLGTAAFSTNTGFLPGSSSFWGTTAGTYVRLPYSSGAVASGTGINDTFVYSGTASPWPNDTHQTNPFREAIWALDKQDGYVYEVTLDASGTNVFLATQRVVRGRSVKEALLDPALGPLIQNGTFSGVAEGVYTTGTVINNLGTLHYTSGSKVFAVADLYTAEQPTGAYVLDMASVTGLAAYNGTSPLTSYYMYLNSRANVQVTNAFTAWTDANVATAHSNSVDYSAAPLIVYSTGSGVFLNTPVLGLDGQLEFQNTSNLLPGNYLLTVESGNIGLPDEDFTGFDVDLTVNSSTQSVKLLSGLSGYNVRGKDVIPVTVTDGVNGNWLLTFDWTNALSDPSRGTKRQLAIFSYELRYLTTQAYRVDVTAPNIGNKPVITALGTDDYAAGTTPGGWFVALNSYGSAASYQHESVVYTSSDTVTNQLPASDVLTSLTNERRSDVIYAGTDVLLSDPGTYAFPTFGTMTITPGGVFNVGQTGSFSVTGTGSLSAIYSYVWRFWDSTGTATPGPSVTKVINTGSNPIASPNGLQVTCIPVAFDGQSAVIVGTLQANNPPVIIPGALLTDNDDYFPFSTQANITVFDFDGDTIYFAWYTGTNFLSHGVSSSAGPVAGTWSGNGTTVIGNFAGFSNYATTTVTSPEVLTCYISDSRQGTTVLDFVMRGQAPPAPSASAGAGGAGLLADVASIPAQRVGAGAVVDFTVYAKDAVGRPLSFYWEFYGTNGWTMSPTQQTGTTTALPDGSVQNILQRDISNEQITSGTQKTSTALCDIFATNPDHSVVQLTEMTVVVTLITNLAPSASTVVRSVDGNEISGTGPVTAGQELEFAVQGTNANSDWMSFMWTFNQPFVPTTLLLWGPKVIVDTTPYTTGQTITGKLTSVDRLGGTYTQDLVVTNIQ